jgi:flagellar biosynthetic protein FlhB
VLGGVGLFASLPTITASLARFLGRSIELVAVSGAASGDWMPLLKAAVRTVWEASWRPCLVFLASAAAAAFVLVGPRWSLGAVAFRWERITPGGNLGELLGGRLLVDTTWDLVRLFMVLGAVVWSAGAQLQWLLGPQPDEIGPALRLLGRPLLAAIQGGMVAVLGCAAIDFALARRRYAAGLRMTTAEARRDHRDEGGDPRQRQALRRAHEGHHQAGPLKGATCLVVNPTRFAVAISHDRESENAPWVLAKGAGREAARLRAQARRAGIPIARHPAFARTLFRLAQVGDEIPEPLHRGAAVILAHIYTGREPR